VALGARRLGRRNRWSRGLESSRDDEVEDVTRFEEDGGNAKSVEDVGRDGREALGIV
jgi:hypothetical protein